MANTAAVYARIDTNLKESAEDILAQLGITPSSAIQMLYRQIVLTRGSRSICIFPLPPHCCGWHEPYRVGYRAAKGSRLSAKWQKFFCR